MRDFDHHVGYAGISNTQASKPERIGMAKNDDNDDPLMTPAEVARLFRVDPKTVTRWARTGRINSIKTLGGHRRYRAAEVEQLLKNADAEEIPPS